jgi:putative acetyltransferase
MRLATAADVPALAALYAATARALGPTVYSTAQVAAWASFGTDSPAFRAYVLEAQTWIAGDPPDGICGIGIHGQLGEVHSLYVRADLTRHGLGTRLLSHALTEARADGCSRFEGWATPFSKPVFERAGFRLLRVAREPYQGVMFDRFRMVSS